VTLLRAFDRFRNGALRVVVRTSVAVTGAALVLAAFGAPDAHAFVVKKTSKGELVHWDQRTVDYTFDPSVDHNVQDAVTATTRAMSSWSGTVGAPELQGHAASTVVDAPPTKPGFDQKNGVFFMPDGYTPAGRALAITVLTYDNASGRILDADIIVNGAYKFAVLQTAADVAKQEHVVTGAHPSNTDGITHVDEPSTSTDTVYDLHHVVAHELGHSLGMNDEMQRKDALMYRYSSPNDTSLRAPATDDIEGLAELYSTKLQTSGGCGNATVAPKKPSFAASHFAMVATLGFLFFLILRGRSDRRARLAFVVAAAVAAYVMLPSIAKDGGNVAKASQLAPGQARAKVLTASTSMEDGLIKTTYKLATTVCRTTTCPKLGTGVAWGGTAGNITQEVGGQYAPVSGDDVDVSFTKLPSDLAVLSQPLGAPASDSASVRVITPAN
jgi:hypothetical protein